MPQSLWTTEECPRCEGSGFAYCSDCEHACEHDRPCPECDGNERVPRRVDGFELLVTGWIGGELHRTKRDALAAIERGQK